MASGFQGATGSTVGPAGALYIAEGGAGRISRVDPKTGEVTTFTTGLPASIAGIGSPMDVTFVGSTAYALVTLVGPEVGGSSVVGIYRIDGPNSSTVIANIGEWAVAHPPKTEFELPTGVQYSIENFRGGFLVADGHHNRVLWVTREGEIIQLKAFSDIVPTGLATSGNTIYMAEAGPIPHLPQTGKVVAFEPDSTGVTEIASGAPLLVDVEFGRGRRLYALSQGEGSGGPAGSPAKPNTGSLVEVGEDGTLTTLVARLNQPTSMEVIGNTAYVVTLAGDLLKIEGLSCPPLGLRAAGAAD